MHCRYSKVVEQSSYEADGLAYDIPLRIHRDPYKEIFGALRAQKDWSEQVHPISDYLGGLGTPYSFIRVTVPECRPERLETVSYANEFAFLYDGEQFSLMSPKSLKDLSTEQPNQPELLSVFNSDIFSQKVDEMTRPEKRLQTQILKEMMGIDPKRAVTTMKAWATFVQLASRTRSTPFETLGEYLPSRIIDAGELIWYGTLTFAMALTILEAELDLCFSLARPGYAAISLTNDLYSWDKERKAAEADGVDYVFNAIWVIMKEQSVSEDEAIAICKEETLKYIAEYDDIVGNVKDFNLSQDTVSYLEAVRYSYIGNLVWSIYCPRYHED
ncbi:terpenoid synthase [Polyplosphaeria fusca]|uniref:Terpenoid synthase n=1 Tax=Polyplosphaeria fusca TaxID=682080 RepID=A0A9P4V3S4_9PLEO|nr:terpenoid synthase [Polyplosphaeria fusca]